MTVIESSLLVVNSLVAVGALWIAVSTRRDSSSQAVVALVGLLRELRASETKTQLTCLMMAEGISAVSPPAEIVEKMERSIKKGKAIDLVLNDLLSRLDSSLRSRGSLANILNDEVTFDASSSDEAERLLRTITKHAEQDVDPNA